MNDWLRRSLMALSAVFFLAAFLRCVHVELVEMDRIEYAIGTD